VLVCAHKTCRRQGAKASLKELRRAIKAHDLRGAVMVTKVKCLDQCGRGPVMAVYPEGVWYGGVDETRAREIVAEHLAAGRPARGAKILRDMRDDER
jgi:(2Fe-2S) ferredoxin